MYFFSDLFLIALLMKLLWETSASNILPRGLFAVAAFGLPFLWGLGGRHTGRILRAGVSMVGLIIFFSVISSQGLHIPYIAMLILGFFLYGWGRAAQGMLSIVIVVFILITIIYFAVNT